MKILVLCDDRWHPASVVKGGLEPLESSGCSFDYIEDAAEWNPDQLKEYPVVILSKSNNVSSSNTDNWMSPEVEEAFDSYVTNGGGLLVIHSGTAGYKETKTLRALMGGVFLNHPEQCPVTMEPAEDHELTEGCVPYTMKDEHYMMELDDKSAEVFMTTASEHGTQPGGWRRSNGNGRVCVLTPGHNLDVWLHDTFQKLLKNSIAWCQGK